MLVPWHRPDLPPSDCGERVATMQEPPLREPLWGKHRHLMSTSPGSFHTCQSHCFTLTVSRLGGLLSTLQMLDWRVFFSLEGTYRVENRVGVLIFFKS